MISYAGIPLTLPTPEMLAWIEGNLDQGRRDVDLWGTRERDMPIGSLVWPVGASRWAEGWFVATGGQLDQIRAVVYADGTHQPAELVMGTGEEVVRADLWLLTPIPLTGYPGDSRLWLLPLVDRRYNWRASGQRVRTAQIVSPAPEEGEDPAPDMWETALRDWFAEVDEADVIIDPRPAELRIGVPASVEFHVEELPDLIDAVAAAGGSRVVVPLKDQWGGRVRIEQPWADETVTEFPPWDGTTSSYVGFPQVDSRFARLEEIQAGGQCPLVASSPADIAAALPGSIRVVSPAEVDGVFMPDGREIVVDVSGLELIGGQTLSEFDAVLSGPQLTVRSLATAGDAEADDLTQIAKAWAWSWYAWRVRRHDVTIPGIWRWEPEGYSDVEWHVSETRCYTRATSADLHEEATPLEQSMPDDNPDIINYYNTTVNYFDTTVNYYNTTITTDINTTVVFGGPTIINYGLSFCGWWWVCPETEVVVGELDPGALDPHSLERLIPSVDGIVVPGIAEVVGPQGTQALMLTNVDPAKSLVLDGVDWFLPGADQLPLRMAPGDGCIAWKDAADDVWRLLSATYGDFRFKASDELTVTIWDENREANFIAPGDVGDVLTQTETGPQWQPPGEGSSVSGEAIVYRTDCMNGTNFRYISTLRFVDGVFLQGSESEGVFVPGLWLFDSRQGCCNCNTVTVTCCPDPVPPRLCVTNTGTDGCECADVETTDLVYSGAVEVPTYGSMPAWYGSRKWQCEEDTTVEYFLICDTSTEPPTWVLVLFFNETDTGLYTATEVSCSPFILNFPADMNPTGTPQGCDEPATITFVVEECTPTTPPDPPPPDCCEDTPTSVVIGSGAGAGTYGLTPIPGVTCLYYYTDATISIVVDTSGIAGDEGFATITLHPGSPCRFTRAVGCLGSYDATGGSCASFPASITVS